MGPWVFLNWSPLARGPQPWLGQWQIQVPRASSGAGILIRLFTRQASRTASPIYRQGAEHSWSFWKADPCPRSRPLSRVEAPYETLDGGRQLEDAQDYRGSGRTGPGH